MPTMTLETPPFDLSTDPHEIGTYDTHGLHTAHLTALAIDMAAALSMIGADGTRTNGDDREEILDLTDRAAMDIEAEAPLRLVVTRLLLAAEITGNAEMVEYADILLQAAREEAE